MREQLYNQRFDDIYFSPQDGLAETKHVFLAGNDLPVRWQGRSNFTIAETGFGTGLNFLAAWNLFERTADKGQMLDYISFELYPLQADDIRQVLDIWRDELGDKLDRMLASYPLRVPGFHRAQIAENVRLTLVFDDVNAALPQLVVPCGVDAWFLDGFAPAKNPEMWTDVLYKQMARLSGEDASVATFTAAGHVRRGLQEAGFIVEKKPGYGRKRDMTAGKFSGGPFLKNKNETNRIAIIGGGLAGTSCAYVLRQRGIKTTIFEKADGLAAGASGNMLGLYNPRFYAQRGGESDFYTVAYAQAVRTLQDISAVQGIDYKQCGALHLVNSPEKQKRYKSLCEHGGWHSDHLQMLSDDEATEKAGIKIDTEAFYLPDSGFVNPHGLCKAYADGVDVRLNTLIEGLEPGKVNGEEFDAVIIASAVAVKDFVPLSWLPVHTVRGQISVAGQSKASAKLKTSLCYGGYISAAYNGQHIVGSTFQKWLNDADVKEQDHEDNLAKLAKAVPALAGGLRITDGRAALRTASQDHFPVIGQAIDGEGNPIKNTYLSVAHGSHGIISSLAGGHLLADMITRSPLSLGMQTTAALDPARFIKRAKKREAAGG